VTQYLAKSVHGKASDLVGFDALSAEDQNRVLHMSMDKSPTLIARPLLASRSARVKNAAWHGVWRTGRTRRACGRRRGGAPDRRGTRGEGHEEVGVLDKLLEKAERGAANVFVWMLLCGLQSRQDGCVQVTEWTKEAANEIIPDCISERV